MWFYFPLLHTNVDIIRGMFRKLIQLVNLIDLVVIFNEVVIHASRISLFRVGFRFC